MSHPMAEQGPAELVAVGWVDEWQDGSAREVKVHKKPMTVVRIGERFFALNSICPHMGGPMSCGTLRDGKLYCPWHEWGFDVETGTCPNGHRLELYRVEVVDGQVMVGWVV